MFELLFFVAVFGGSGYGLYRDSKNGFINTRFIIEKVSGGKIELLHSQEDKHLIIAETAVANTAKNVSTLRESIAEIDANMQMAMKQSIEQTQLARSFQGILDQVVNNPDRQEEVQVAAVAKVESQKRANLFQGLANSQASVLIGLQKELDSAEMELDISRTKASTIKVFVAITHSRKSLYSLQSSVSQEGLTPKGEIDNAIYEAEKEMIKSATLLDMVSKNSGSRAKKLLSSLDIDNEIDAARKRSALPPAPAEAQVQALSAQKGDIINRDVDQDDSIIDVVSSKVVGR